MNSQLDLEDEKLKDSILRELLQNNISIMKFEMIFPDRKEDLEEALEDLLSIEYIEMPYADGGGTFSILKKGKKFITKTSFEEQAVLEHQFRENKYNEAQRKEKLKEEREDIEFNWKKRDEKRKNTTVIFTVLLGILAFWNGYLQWRYSGNCSLIKTRLGRQRY